MELHEVTIPCLVTVDRLKQTGSEMGLKCMDTPPPSAPDRSISEARQKKTVKKGTKRKLSGETDEYEVEDVLNYTIDEEGNNWYLVKWKGWSSGYNSWEPQRNLVGCSALIKKFHKKVPKNKSLNLSLKSFKSKQLKIDSFLKIISKPSVESITALVNQAAARGKKHDVTSLKKLLATSLKKKTQAQANGTLNGSKGVTIPKDWLNNITEQWLAKRIEVAEKLKAWEHVINGVSGDACPIVIENEVDLEGPPENFTYINDYKPAEGIIIPDDPLVGCECTDCYDNRKNCCAHQCGGCFAYNKNGRLRVPIGSPIYECNKRCKCPPDCPNRVVQHGRKVKLAIFRTANGCGWGVRTLVAIRKDSFVMEYVGEVITNEDAEKRGKIYDAQGRTYLFDLDYNDGDCPYTVDAASFGNVSHFMNHSCEPNLVVFSVWINNLDPSLPRIAFFSNRDIKRGEELTFDYMMTADTTQSRNNLSASADDIDTSTEEQKRIRCKCGTANCREYLF